MKLSDYVASWLADHGLKTAFAITGGASLHLIHSLSDHPAIEVVCPHHEQAAAMAADGYARASRSFGVAVATSGPGATNLITGICCSYFDSVPVLYLTGQVSTFRFRGDTGIRQMGFQETDIVSMCRDITKYAVLLTDPLLIRYELEKALWLAKSGRPGPVLIDIPDNLQREEVDPTTLIGFEPTPPVLVPPFADQLQAIAQRLNSSQRPVVIVGWGVRLAGAEREAIDLINRLGIPVALTWAMLDLLPHDHPLLTGSFGTHGLRSGNFAVQNSDFVLAIGARLDTHEIGSPATDFARQAYKVVVDIDAAEVNKFSRYGLNVDQRIVADARMFLDAANSVFTDHILPECADWKELIANWKKRYPPRDEKRPDTATVAPYGFVRALSAHATDSMDIVVDTGCAVAWMSQAFNFKAGQRYFHAFNNTPMGYALPAAVGVSLASARRSVICVVGDGSLQMNVQELATIAFHRLPIKIFVINNKGYGMIQQTQDQWLGGRYIASSFAGGLGFPDFVALAKAYGIDAITLNDDDAVEQLLPSLLGGNGPLLCNVEISPAERVRPQVKFGRGIEDAEPLLERSEFLANMLIPPLKSSIS